MEALLTWSGKMAMTEQGEFRYEAHAVWATKCCSNSLQPVGLNNGLKMYFKQQVSQVHIQLEL
jgi:hypothetical protein